MKKFFVFIVLLAVAVCAVNAQTNFFLDLGQYLPVLEEKYPKAVNKISEASQKLSAITDMIPTPSEIIAAVKNEEMPLDPADVAVNAYIENSPMLSFYPDENISMMITNDGKLNIFGTTSSPNKRHLILGFGEGDGNENQESISVDNNNKFNKTISIPNTDKTEIPVSVYAGSKAYGEFESWVYNYVMLEKNASGNWQIKKSPVYDNNKVMYEKDKSTSDALKNTLSIQSSNDSVKSIANQITAECETDYDKLIALHDWVCSYIYYDVDSLSSEQTPAYSAVEVIKNRKAVCLGFATLYAALCRSIDIPCNVVSGYALGVGNDTVWDERNTDTSEQNHAWNEAYVDGRWIIIDTTWDCTNKIEYGERIDGKEVSHLYFDANIEFFSNNHKILEYSKRR